MCGIAGFSLSHDSTLDTNALGRALLLGIEHRGKDATGAGWWMGTGESQAIQFCKLPVPASTFIARQGVARTARTAIFHTRASTKGDAKFAVNNHPIKYGSLLGVHNGVIYNDDDIFRQHDLERYGQVDSEAIWARIHAAIGAQENWATTDIGKALEDLEGWAALAWLDARDVGGLYLARQNSSPLLYASISDGSLLFASTLDTLKKGAEAVGQEMTEHGSFSEGQLAIVEGGDFTEATTFTPGGDGRRYTSFTSMHSRSLGHGGWTDWDDDTRYSNYWKSKSVAVIGNRTKVSLVEPGFTFVRHDAEGVDRGHYLSDQVFTLTSAISDKMYHSQYGAREDEIDATILGLEQTYANDDTIDDVMWPWNTAADMGAFLRPGTPVRVRYQHTMRDAEIVALPQTFPEGEYVLRVLMPVYDMKDRKEEYVMIQRSVADFTFDREASLRSVAVEEASDMTTTEEAS